VSKNKAEKKRMESKYKIKLFPKEGF